MGVLRRLDREADPADPPIELSATFVRDVENDFQHVPSAQRALQHSLEFMQVAPYSRQVGGAATGAVEGGVAVVVPAVRPDMGTSPGA